MITELTRNDVRILRSDLQKELDKVGKRFGLAFTLGNCRFNASNATFKLEAALKRGGKVMTKEATAWPMNAKYRGILLKVGDTFTFRGAEYKIEGWATRRHAYPVSATGVRDGKSYKFPASTVEFTPENIKAKG